MSIQLEEIAPRTRQLVYDLVKEAGADVSDWENFKRGAEHAASNPRYCYEWSFVDSDSLVVLNLWHGGMRERNGVVEDALNMRAFAHRIVRLRDDPWRKGEAKAVWEKRALKMDRAIQLAARKRLPVRVIVCEGDERDIEAGDDEASRVHKRLLDPVPWAVTHYDWSTGEVMLTRGVPAIEFVDQFSAPSDPGEQAPEKRVVEGSVFVRSAEVRRRVLLRAKGICELCGTRGFTTAAGQVYLETHHVVPLSEGGADSVFNVVALCPNDHRRAHHGADRVQLQERLQRVGALLTAA
ncbi:MAG: HNH endonuclease [Hydrogenophaga sp.]|jgi:5-methylcytosine-specific restriction protein A|uniref:HNH endonuclease n=1 Tax=Hydrogenophaga sp. TaxID=1904254 RepID=UPI001D8175B5|nr:HNH endonuclease signature motif containing protein [Hydrogenophaga sp.]MBW0170707.1 HNH endonuclease [Hydrogenophaga sp.]MBW0185544.1 HNH endonuclease [Hydrogenophaga sp.]